MILAAVSVSRNESSGCWWKCLLRPMMWSWMAATLSRTIMVYLLLCSITFHDFLLPAKFLESHGISSPRRIYETSLKKWPTTETEGEVFFERENLRQITKLNKFPDFRVLPRNFKFQKNIILVIFVCKTSWGVKLRTTWHLLLSRGYYRF